ncbi:MAG: hypothetical protein WBP72_05870 [Rhodocyclaceae bacterium]
MNRSLLTGQRLVGLFLLGCVLFNYPVLYLFNHPVRVLGIPLLYLYVFIAWAVLVALMAWVSERRGE